MAITILRSELLPDGRSFDIAAGPLGGGRFEAWIQCTAKGKEAGAGPMSPALKVANSVQELKEWADSLTPEGVKELIQIHCE